MAVFSNNPALRNAWYPVAESGDVQDQPLKVRLLEQDLVLWRPAAGVVAAAPDRCPHREAPLSIGSVSAGTLTCAYHGWRFDRDGSCVGIPSSGPNPTVPANANLKCLAAEEHYGLIWVCPGTPPRSVPLIDQEHQPEFRRINTGFETWQVSATRMVDNFMDISHFPWVHTGTFGNDQAAEVPNIEMRQLDQGFFGYSYEVQANNPAAAGATSLSEAEVVHRYMTTGFHLPFTVRSTIRYPDGLEHILLLCSTPIDDLSSRFTFVVWRNDDHSTDPDEIISFDRAIGAEDKLMLEQVPGVLGLEQTSLISVQADKPSVQWRQQFVALLNSGSNSP